jgi:hypothetical protein
VSPAGKTNEPKKHEEKPKEHYEKSEEHHEKSEEHYPEYKHGKPSGKDTLTCRQTCWTYSSPSGYLGSMYDPPP